MTKRLPGKLFNASIWALPLALALSTPVDLRAQPNWQGGASIAVAVLDKSGGPIVGATVTLHRGSELAGPGPAPLLTDREGHASFSGLADGEWVLEVTHPEFMAYRAYLEAKTGKEAKSTFAAQVATNQSFSPMRVSLYKSHGPAGTPIAAAGPGTPPAAPAPPAATGTASPPPAPSTPLPAPVAPVAPVTPAAPVSPPTATAPVAPTSQPHEVPREVPGASGKPARPTPPTPPPPPAAPRVAAAPPASPAAAAAPHGVPGDSGASAKPAPVTLPPPAPATPPPAPRQAPVPPAPPAPAPAPAPRAAAVAPQPPTPAPVPPPTPKPAPAIPPAIVTAPAAAAPVAAAPVRSATRSNCPECKPGESALAVDSIAGPAPAAGACTPAIASAAAAALREAAAHLPAGSPSGVFVDGSGFGLGLPGPAAAGFQTTLAAVMPSNAPCRLLAVTLPTGAKYLGYRYDASDTTGSGDCMQGQECPIKRCGFAEHAAIEHGANGSLVWVLFENRDSERARRAELVVYYRASPGATP